MEEVDEAFSSRPLVYVEGIASYVIEEDYFFRELDICRVWNLIELAKHEGWKKVVLSLRNRLVTQYITDPSRSLFLNLVKIKSGCKVLDLGAGCGSVSLQIAKRFPDVKVYALDKTLEGLIFLNIVKEQENLKNIMVARCTAEKIPLLDSSIDVAYMIGVLEWVATNIDGQSPRHIQVNVLREVRRTLNMGGKLIIGIENRFGYQYLAGKPEHSGIRYGSVLPTKLINLYSKRVLHKEYRTLIYSRDGYKKLLLEAGYKNIQFFGAYPNYRFPVMICDENSIKHMIRSSSKKGLSKLLRYLPNALVKKIVPSYFIVAEK